MNYTPSELLTIQFYEWEQRGRGYYHFDFCVDIEPPYIPMEYHVPMQSGYKDDGRAEGVFKKIGSIFTPKETEPKIKETEIIPTVFNSSLGLKGFSLSFAKGQEISHVLFSEFINVLSYSAEPLSFEILGKSETINIQIICCSKDEERIKTHISGYFPTIQIQEVVPFDLGFDTEQTVGIADFGLSEEFMLPIATNNNFSLDPLTPIISLCDSLKENETLLFQMIFKGVTAPWSQDILYSVSDGMGGSFFADSPEMLNQAKEKISKPLFSVIMRMAVQGKNEERTQYLGTELARNISSVSASQFNKLIPLSNEQYDYQEHLKNVYHRTSNRLGMILNTDELVTFAHYPNKSIVSKKLHAESAKTKRVPNICLNQKHKIGINIHDAIEKVVALNDTQFLQHTHIIGATGVGKSTLIATMMLEKMRSGNGCVLFDPHGDIVEDILKRIPTERIDDVIIIDPSDTEFPVGFNLLHAHSEAEKIVLSSDLVSAFKRHATAWGDNMTAVLSNAINTFLESSTGGTLIELKRFLIEESFRNDFLETVDDNSLHYYWEHEYHMVKKGIAPLLTRIDTFLRPKIVRFMLAQKQGIDFKACVEEKKIVLIKLSQGLIGEENSFLLASLFVSKFNQVAQGRQSLSKENRHPYFMYLDEFHNYITPSISSILSGARKYGLGLILAHQNLAQIEDSKTLNAVLSNSYNRICFRLGDNDASKLESGFEFFERNDLQGLGIGEVIMRVGAMNNDFNLTTYPLQNPSSDFEYIRKSIVHNTRNQFAKPKEEIQILIDSLLPRTIKKKTWKPEQKELEPVDSNPKNNEISTKKEIITPTDIPENAIDKIIKRDEKTLIKREHNHLQATIKKLGQDFGFLSVIEKETKSGGRIDVALEKDNHKIACEISVTNKPDYEVKNISKCIADGYDVVIMISDNKSHLDIIKKLAKEQLPKKDLEIVLFTNSKEISSILGSMNQPKRKTEIVKGFRVITEYSSDSASNSKSIRAKIAGILGRNKK